MKLPEECLYRGTVTHKRFAPVRHALRYTVFNVLLDVDRLDGLRVRWLSHNKWNLFSIHDSDHGDGSPLPAYLRGLLAKSPGGDRAARIFMFCYPRVLGYVFNPLTVYFCYDLEGSLTHLIYEVNNTFGDRNSYVIPAKTVADVIEQGCAKALYVSPFNAVEGRYAFHVRPPGASITVGVALRDARGPCLNAYVTGERRALSDGNLLRMFFGFPLMTLKVIGGIHWEALKLWLKGLRIKPRPPRPAPPYSISKTARTP